MSAPTHVERCRQWLLEQIETMGTLRTSNVRDLNFKSWRQNTVTAIQRIWPADRERVERFRRIVFTAPHSKPDAKLSREWFGKGIGESRAYLTSLLEIIEREGVPEGTDAAHAGHEHELEGEVGFPMLELDSEEAPAELVDDAPEGLSHDSGGLSVTPGYTTPDEQGATPRDPASPAPPSLSMRWRMPSLAALTRREIQGSGGPPRLGEKAERAPKAPEERPTVQIPRAPSLPPLPAAEEPAVAPDEPTATHPPEAEVPSAPHTGTPAPAKPSTSVPSRPATPPVSTPAAQSPAPAKPPAPAPKPLASSPPRPAPTAPSRESAQRPSGRGRNGRGKGRRAAQRAAPARPVQQKPKLKDLLGLSEFEAPAADQAATGRPEAPAAPVSHAPAAQPQAPAMPRAEARPQPASEPARATAPVSHAPAAQPQAPAMPRAEARPQPTSESVPVVPPAEPPTARGPESASVAVPAEPVIARHEAPAEPGVPGPHEETPADTEDAPESEEALEADRARATVEFLLNSPVFGAVGKPVQRRTDTTEFLDPDAVALATFAVDLTRLGVPEAMRVSMAARLIDVARHLENGELDWALLRAMVTDAMQYPLLARRLLPVLLPWLERAA